MLTKKQIDYFTKRVQYWADRLGCQDTKFIVEPYEDKKDEYAIADYESFFDLGTVTINLNTLMGGKNNLDRVAFHEVFESAYLGKLRALAAVVFNVEFVDERTHSAVRKAENTIYKAMK